MRQAKARGTKEQRVIEGEQLAKEKRTKELKARQDYFDSLTPEQREKLKKSKILVSSLIGMVASTGLSARIGKNF